MNRIVSRRLGVVAAIAVAGLGMTACSSSGGGSGGTTETTTVKLGFMGDLTGPNKALGINIRNGAKLAIDQYNATNPAVKIELKEYDSQGDPKQATSLAPTAIDDGIIGMVGPAFSGETGDTGPIWEEAKVPIVSASATRVDLADNGWAIFHRVVADDGMQGPGVANFIVKGLGVTKLAVVDDKAEYGAGLAAAVADAAKTAGAQVVVQQSVAAEGTTVPDYSSVVNAIKNAGAEAVFYGGYYAQSGPFAKQLKDGGVNAKFVSDDGSLDPAFIKGAGAAADGSYMSCACSLINETATGAQATFFTDYKAAFGQAPGTYSPEGYDAATVFIDGIKAGNTTRETLLSYVGGVNFDGVSKHIQFEANGNLSGGTILMYKVVNGQLTNIGTTEEATG